MKRSFIATVYTGGLCKTNIAATNANNPAPKMHIKLPALRNGGMPAACEMEHKMTKWVSSVGIVAFKGHFG